MLRFAQFPDEIAAGSSPKETLGSWGEGLAYPGWIQGLLPALHDGFTVLNRYVSVPALKAGLGRYVSNPLTGYLMILRTRGRKSGEMRDVPLGYTIVDDRVYCVAGFGRPTQWFQNVLADPSVEVILPSRAFSGLAEEVTDSDERRRVLVPLLRSMGVVAGMVGLGNPWRDGPEEIERKCEGMPLVRVRATGIAAGPEDPGGRYWIAPMIVGTYLILSSLRGRSRHRA
ncbi:MAG TPA: nitroreductase/quinone reductase family protein [Candidatus Limnocylindrales bacterium]|jgi:deazaflavin-dependent oxidoreductase (nitroreductase family)